MQILVQFVPDLRSEFFPSRIQDQKYSGPRIKELRIKDFLSSRKYDLGCSSRIRILIFYLSWIQGSKMHRVLDPQHCSCIFLSVFFITTGFDLSYHSVSDTYSGYLSVPVLSSGTSPNVGKGKTNKDTGRLHCWALWFGIEPSVNCTSGDLRWRLWIAPQVTWADDYELHLRWPELTTMNCTSGDLSWRLWIAPQVSWARWWSGWRTRWCRRTWIVRSQKS